MSFGKFPFKWADETQTVDDTMAARKANKRMGPPIKEFLVPGLLLFGFVAVAWLYFAGRSKPEAETVARLEPSQLTATALALAPVATPTAMPSLLIPSPTASPTPWLKPTPLVTKTPLFARVVTATLSSPVVASSLASSPLPTPTPPAVVEAVVYSPILPTPTTSLYDYLILNHDVGPETEKLYSYVSGWIVEPDGSTPRPVGVKLCHPSACMHYPRPNNRDVANGYYEFLVSPGLYWLEVSDTKSPVVQLEIGTQERHEVSFQLTTARPLAQAVVSDPWTGAALSGNQQSFGSGPAATATPAPHLIYLPAIIRANSLKNRLYLPLLLK